MKPRVAAWIVSLMAVALAGCDAGSRAASDPTGVNLFLTDTAIDLPRVHAVNVSFGRVTLYPAEPGAAGIELGGGPISLPGDLTLNLLDYQDGRVTFLGSQAVPAGSYDRVRLEIVSAEIVRDADANPSTPDVREPIDIDSRDVDVPVLFTLTPGETLAITVDFDAKASVHKAEGQRGSAYALRPVVNVVAMTSS